MFCYRITWSDGGQLTVFGCSLAAVYFTFEYNSITCIVRVN